MTDQEPRPFLIERAVFGSSEYGSVKGYHLLGWSSGIDSQIGKELSQWSPTRMALDANAGVSPGTWSLQAFPVGLHHMAVGRTVACGPEYSGRGSAHVVTTYLVLDGCQWRAYQYDALGLFSWALALGHLRVPFHLDQRILETAELPSELPLPPPYYPAVSQPSMDDCSIDERQVGEWAEQIGRGRHLLLVGLKDPIQVLATLVQHLPLDVRKRLSLSTGLPLSAHRRFQVHCLVSSTYRQQLALADWLFDAVYEWEGEP